MCQRLMQAGLQAVFLVDTKGLITESRGDDKPEHKKVFMRTDDTPDMKVRGFAEAQGTCETAVAVKQCTVFFDRQNSAIT